MLIGRSPNARRMFELTGTEFLLDEQEAVSLFDQFIGSRADRFVQNAVPDRAVHV